MMQCFLSAGGIPDNIWFSEEWYNAIVEKIQKIGKGGDPKQSPPRS